MPSVTTIYSSPTPPFCSAAYSLVVYKDGILYNEWEAFDLRKRQEIWQTFEKFESIVTLYIVDSKLFTSNATNICIKSLQDGKTIWCSNEQNSQIPVVLGNLVYIINGNHNVITALDLSNGNKVGELKISNFNIFPANQQLMAGTSDKLFFASGNELFVFEK